MSTGISKKLIGNGSASYVAGQQVQYPLEQVKNTANFGRRKKGYLRRIIVETSLKLNNSTGGDITISKLQLYNYLKLCRLHTQEHDFIDLKLSAGQALWFYEYLKTGKNPEIFSAVVVPLMGTITTKIKHIISCYDLRGDSPEDELILLDMLDEGTFELTWEANTTPWGAGVTIDSASTFTVTTESVPRDEWRIPTLWKLEEKQQQSLNDTITPNQVYFRDIFMLASPAVGSLATPAFAAANISAGGVNLTFDGVKVCDNLNPESLVTTWNSQVPNASEANLPQWEGGTCFALPLVHMAPSSGKKTKLAYSKGKPQLELQGTIATTAIRLLNNYIVPAGSETFAKIAARVGFSGGAPGAKTSSKSSISPRNPRKGLVLPQKASILPGDDS